MFVIQVQLSPFPRHHTPPPPIPTSHPWTYPLWLCLWVLYTCSLMTFSLFPPIISLPLPSGYCQFILNFNVSGYILFACFVFFLFKYILLIMLLQLSHFPLYSPPPCAPPSTRIPPFSSCPWVIHISSLASTFPILFLTFPCLFSTYHLCYLFSVPPTSLLITLHVISISVALFLF